MLGYETTCPYKEVPVAEKSLPKPCLLMYERGFGEEYVAGHRIAAPASCSASLSCSLKTLPKAGSTFPKVDPSLLAGALLPCTDSPSLLQSTL